MNTSNRDSYVSYRVEKSKETLEVAKLLVENKRWNSAINRLYYAAYYAVSALLVKSNVETKTHAGVKRQFFLHYVKTGLVAVSKGKLYSDLFDWRQKGDYGDFFDFTEQDVKTLMKPTEELIAAVIYEINNNSSPPPRSGHSSL